MNSSKNYLKYIPLASMIVEIMIKKGYIKISSCLHNVKQKEN